jgi:hypothetical protein
MSSWPGMCWAGDKGAFQTRSTCHHFRRISQQLGKWLMYTPAYAFPWSGSRLMGARLLAFEIWTQTRHPPVGGMLRTQQRLSVLLDCALPGFFTKRFASRRGSKANNGKYRRIRPGQHRSSRQHHSTNNVNKTTYSTKGCLTYSRMWAMLRAFLHPVWCAGSGASSNGSR